MTYQYSICHPDKEEIEYRNNPISSNEVINIAKNYPWLDQLKFSETLDQNNLYYSPSLDFNCIEDGKSFCLTAHYNDNKELEFSLWYNRPKRIKVLFGLLGEKEKMVVDDVWSFDINKALQYLEHFVDRKYQIIEELYKK